ncbi:MAG TPA: hypothetical protein VN840_11120 [Streptosporangiaceae bacterium]|nr:hypothetical protein [Streptosporangiaceae bacterium]
MAIAGCTGHDPSGATKATALVIDTCRDSAGQQGKDPAPARLVDGVDGFIGDTNASDTLPVQNVGGQRYLVWKAALAVAPTARPYRTVSVISPASARLVYPRGVTSRVRLPACGRRYTLYTGGIVVRHPACVTLGVVGPAGRPATVTVPVLVARC